MKTRIITGLCIAVLGLPILFLSQYIIYPVVLSLLSVIALYEIYRVMHLHDKLILTVPTYLISAAFPILVYFFVGKLEHLTLLSYEILLLFCYLFYALLVAVLKNKSITTSDVSRCFFAATYITVSFTSLSIIRYIENGEYYIALVFIAAWATDVFAYFIGSFFGKHKLAPVVSPKKSIEGAVGGTVCCTLCFMLYGLIVSSFFGAQNVSYVKLLIIGFVLSIVAQIGDLACSLIKREYGVKDYGNILPGHGGILDRFDSVISVATILMVLCTFLSPIG